MLSWSMVQLRGRRSWSFRMEPRAAWSLELGPQRVIQFFLPLELRRTPIVLFSAFGVSGETDIASLTLVSEVTMVTLFFMNACS